MTASMQIPLDQYRVVATAQELRLDDVSFADLAAHFHERPDFVLLHSQTNNARLDRYSLFSFAPVARLVTKGATGRIRIGDREMQCQGDPFDMLRLLLNRFRPRRSFPGDLPFFGGAIGYFAYELGRHVEVLPAHVKDDLETPDIYLGFYTFAVVLEHRTGRIFICSVGAPRYEKLARFGGIAVRRTEPGNAWRVGARDAAFSIETNREDLYP